MYIHFVALVLAHAFAANTLGTRRAPASCGVNAYPVKQVAQGTPYQQTPGAQVLDIYIPDGAPKPYKTIMMIHGGCFEWGGRNQEDTKEYINRLVRAGYAVVSIDYRLSNPNPKDPAKSVNKYPASLEDVEDAWCWVQNYGNEKYQLNTDKMVAMGYSAGATLAAYLGTHHKAGSSHRPNCRPKVAAVIDFFGRTNLMKSTEPRDPNKMDCGEAYVGERRNDQNPQPEFKDADVLTNMDPSDTPPFFAAHGTADKSVDFQNSVELCQKMGKENCELLAVPGADHMFEKPGEMDKAFDGACKFLATKVFEHSRTRMATAPPGSER
jgi:acetyl esterase/lipase